MRQHSRHAIGPEIWAALMVILAAEFALAGDQQQIAVLLEEPEPLICDDADGNGTGNACDD